MAVPCLRYDIFLTVSPFGAQLCVVVHFPKSEYCHANRSDCHFGFRVKVTVRTAHGYEPMIFFLIFFCMQFLFDGALLWAGVAGKKKKKERGLSSVRIRS